MTRRLRIAGTAFGALLVPACASFQPDAPAPRPVSAMPPPVTPVGYRPMPSAMATQAAKPRVVEKFAEGRAEAVATQPPAPVADPPPEKVAGLVPVEHTAPAPVPAPVDPPRLVLPVIGNSPPPEPPADGEGVIRPHWPVIKGAGPIPEPPAPAPTDSNVVLPPPSELMKNVAGPANPPTPMIPPANPDEASGPTLSPPLAAPAVTPPPALPPGVIGSSIHQTNASPAGTTPVAAATTGDPVTPAAVTGDKPPPAAPIGHCSALLRAVQAFQQNKPDEAVECLKAYDPTTQQILLSLLPAMARLSEGRLQSMKPEEMDVLLDQLTRVPSLLRPKASLRADNVRLCREVHNFAHVEPFPDRHEFRPGDVVYLYMELANFTCVPKSEPKDGYTITLASSLELKDSAGAVVWRADPKEAADVVSTPPQDYYRNFRLCVPGVPPGTYTLTVKTIDRPSGREAVKAIEMRVGAR